MWCGLVSSLMVMVWVTMGQSVVHGCSRGVGQSVVHSCGEVWVTMVVVEVWVMMVVGYVVLVVLGGFQVRWFMVDCSTSARGWV